MRWESGLTARLPFTFATMKNLLIVLLSMVSVVVLAQPSTRLSDALYMTNDQPIVKFKIVDNSTNGTLPWMEFGSQTNVVFSLSRSGVIGVASTGLQTGTNVTGANGLATNTFSPVFSAPPRVFLTPLTHTVTNYVVSVDATNVVTKSDPSVTNQILAVPSL